jgi:hypothetical protein
VEGFDGSEIISPLIPISFIDRLCAAQNASSLSGLSHLVFSNFHETQLNQIQQATASDLYDPFLTVGNGRSTLCP